MTHAEFRIMADIAEYVPGIPTLDDYAVALAELRRRDAIRAAAHRAAQQMQPVMTFSEYYQQAMNSVDHRGWAGAMQALRLWRH